MRFNFRIKVKNLTIFGMIAQTQTIEGVSSLQSDGKHIVMLDLDSENITLTQIQDKLRKIQSSYGLGDIFIVSDYQNSYRAWSFTKVNFDTYLHILVDCLDILDYSFFYYTVKRKKATLRTSKKLNRPKQHVVLVLKSYAVSIPTSNDVVEQVIYDTGLEKKGISLLIGDKE